GFIDGPEEVMQLERELLTFIFERLNQEIGSVLARYRAQHRMVTPGNAELRNSGDQAQQPENTVGKGGLPPRPQQTQLPSMLEATCWEFDRCLDLLKYHFNRTDLTDDLDPEAERQLCALAEKETGIPAIFVVGFPLSSRPFYTAPRGSAGAAQ